LSLRDQGLTSFESFVGLEEEDINMIVDKIRTSGGSYRRGARFGVNTGLELGFLYSERLEMLRFYVNHCRRIQRPLVVADMTIAHLTSIYEMKKMEDAARKEVIELPDKNVQVDNTTGRNNNEDLDDRLSRKLGASGFPVAYVVRETVALQEDDEIKAVAESTLNCTNYDGQRSFTFEQYVSTLQKAFTDLESIGATVAEERKVQILLRGITAPSMLTAVGIVMLTTALKTNYDVAVNYLANVDPEEPSVSSYFSYKIWDNLTGEQREIIKIKRKEQQNNRNRQLSLQTVITGTGTDGSTNESVTGDATQTISNVGSIMSRRAHRGN